MVSMPKSTLAISILIFTALSNVIGGAGAPLFLTGDTMLDNFYNFLPFVLKGTWTTIALCVVSLLISVLFGIVGAAMKLSDNSLLQGIGAFYTTLIRSIPELVMMLIIFFGGQILLNNIVDATGLIERIQINQFFAGSIAIGFIYGSYMTEAFRGAYLSIPKGQIEAAKSFGMKPSTWLKEIVWPQFVPLVLPTFTNNWLVLMKTTALVSLIGLQDLTYTAQQAGKSTAQPFIFLFVAFLIYLVLTILSDLGLRAVERRYYRA